ncbi:hypothetical protein PoB_001979100 [Plakobranchus ocellatus]|uniref:Uncharacterized protein n=1 Tax=Plakobranchus ocellatus TaxID=259542 RepID=A0AAV3ZBI5_9GAST|nr:hypothetical protein PoB_001979100 [Plakobranchus ocellatus]
MADSPLCKSLDSRGARHMRWVAESITDLSVSSRFGRQSRQAHYLSSRACPCSQGWRSGMASQIITGLSVSSRFGRQSWQAHYLSSHPCLCSRGWTSSFSFSSRAGYQSG